MVLKPRDDIAFQAGIAVKKLGYVSGQIELVSKCFQKCAHCSSWKDDLSGKFSGEMPEDLFWSIYEQLKAMPTFGHLTLTGGDPQACSYFDKILEGHLKRRKPFELQINTAFVKPVNKFSYSLWNAAINQLRVSLDAVDKDIYRYLRGDKETNPLALIGRLADLHHNNLTTMTIVYNRNIDHIPELVRVLDTSSLELRKAIFMAGIGRAAPHDKTFWGKYNKLSSIKTSRIKTSFDENVLAVREYLEKMNAGANLRCWAGAMSFHIKFDGSMYPCCLTGGEAIDTNTAFLRGNVRDHSLRDMVRSYVPKLDYAQPGSPCREICQYKQLLMNYYGEKASKTVLAMP
jgi:MoaA/NifB/PqqE/SkfB family radical SAM enzyme